MTTLLNRLRTRFLKPNSPLELRLRTLYHRFNATRMAFRVQDCLVKRSYRRWRKRHLARPVPGLASFNHQPLVTFILPFSNASDAAVDETIQSILGLAGDRWEVILLTGQDNSKVDPHFVSEPCIKVSHDTPEDLRRSISGDYVILCQPGDRFDKQLLAELYAHDDPDNPAVVYFYDIEYPDPVSNDNQPLFKPAAISPVTLVSCNLLSRGMIKAEVFKSHWQELDHTQALLTREYELIARLCEYGMVFKHIPALLASQIDLPAPNDAHYQLIVDHLARCGCENVSFDPQPVGRRFVWETGSPSITIVIPTRNNHRFLDPLLTSIFRLPDMHNLHVNLVDNSSDDSATLAYYDRLQDDPTITLVPYNKPFNYSEAINLGVLQSDSDLVLLLNDDILPIDPHWLGELSQWALRPEVGVVGAKLLRANHTIQHAGIIMGIAGFMGHLYLNAPEGYHGLLGSADWVRQYLALTGACQMMRRKVFDEIGGYDQGYKLAFGDIDFCLRVHEQGYRNIYTPFARLYHYEGVSRGYNTPTEDALRGYQRMEPYLLIKDPFFNPNLTYTRIPKCQTNSQNKFNFSQSVEDRKYYYLSLNK